MITNEVQYRNTKVWLDRFGASILELEAALPAAKYARLHQLKIDAARAQAEDLRVELAEYEALRSGGVRRFEVTSLLGLADALIKARIARRWTQARLAQELGVAEQQVQRYESTGYLSASLARLADVANALGVEITETVVLAGADGDAA